MRVPIVPVDAPTHGKYRPEIDGLRALAVLAVVGYHAFPAQVTGGFVGVDVFFVISGYLISSILIDDVAQRRFSLIAFYRRRVLRIFPALALVLVACLALGWTILFADEFARLARHVIAGAGFAANLLLWSEAGYFDAVSDTKPLLHLWSLGVEEQFYVVWPLVVVALARWRVNGLAVVALLGALSFALNVHGVHDDPVGTFYSPLTRFWELMMGAALAFAERSPRRDAWLDRRPVVAEVLAGCGTVAIGIAVLGLTNAMAFPGWLALLPTVGAALLIVAGRRASINRRFFASRPMVAIGLISFPLYLWHWPLLVFARVLGGGTPSVTTRCSLVVAAFALALATYVAWEKPLRFRGWPRRQAAGLVVAMVLVALVGLRIERRGGMPGRPVVALNGLSASGYDGGDGGYVRAACGIADARERARFAYCLEDAREPPRLALVGDSKAGALYAGLIRTSSAGSRWLFIGGTGPQGSTLAVLSDDPLYRFYRPFALGAIDAIAHDPRIDTVTIVNSTRALFQLASDTSLDDLPGNANEPIARAGLAAAVDVFVRAGKRVVLVVDNPTLPHPEDCIARRSGMAILDALFARPLPAACAPSYRRQLALSSNYRSMLDAIAAKDPTRVRVFDPLPLLCDARDDRCPIAARGRMLYGQTDHLSDFGAGLVGRSLNAFVGRDGS